MALYHAVDVNQSAGFTLYPRSPELLLCLCALYFWRFLYNKPRHQKVLAAFGLTAFYTGALALSMLLIG